MVALFSPNEEYFRACDLELFMFFRSEPYDSKITSPSDDFSVRSLPIFNNLLFSFDFEPFFD